MNKQKILSEIISLIDAEPLEYVDIKPLIESYCVDMDITQQKQVRGVFRVLIEDLAKEDDIQLEQSATYSLSTTQHGFFLDLPIKIKSTMKYEKEKKKNNAILAPTIQVAGNFTGTLTAGNDNHSSFERNRPSDTPNEKAIANAKKKNTIKSVLLSIWDNIVLRILVGLAIVALAAYFGFKK